MKNQNERTPKILVYAHLTNEAPCLECVLGAWSSFLVPLLYPLTPRPVPVTAYTWPLSAHYSSQSCTSAPHPSRFPQPALDGSSGLVHRLLLLVVFQTLTVPSSSPPPRFPSFLPRSHPATHHHHHHPVLPLDLIPHNSPPPTTTTTSILTPSYNKGNHFSSTPTSSVLWMVLITLIPVMWVTRKDQVSEQPEPNLMHSI